MSADSPTIMFVTFFHVKCLVTVDKYIVVIPASLHCVQGKHASDEKLKIYKLGPFTEAQNPLLSKLPNFTFYCCILM